MESPFTAHVELLRKELDRRKAENRRYSLRAFAILLGIHPSALSRILNRKQDLSTNACIAILIRVKFSPEVAREFIVSVANHKHRLIVNRLSVAAGLPIEIEVPKVQ